MCTNAYVRLVYVVSIQNFMKKFSINSENTYIKIFRLQFSTNSSFSKDAFESINLLINILFEFAYCNVIFVYFNLQARYVHKLFDLYLY